MIRVDAHDGATGAAVHYRHRLASLRSQPLDAGTAVALRTALRDAEAVIGRADAEVLAARLRMARWMATSGDPRAREWYASYADAAGRLAESATARDIAFLVGQEAWSVLEAWHRADRRTWLAVAVVATADSADGFDDAGNSDTTIVAGLLRLHEAVRTSRSALVADVEVADGPVRRLGELLVDLMDHPHRPGTTGDVLAAAQEWAREHGALVGALVASAGLWAGLPRLTRADDRVGPLADLVASAPTSRVARVLADWAQDRALLLLLGADLDAAALPGAAPGGDPAPLRRSSALIELARAHACLGPGGGHALRETLTEGLDGLLGEDRAETWATFELRAALVLVSMREGDTAAARAELAQLEAVTATHSPYARGVQRYLGSLLERSTRFPLDGRAALRLDGTAPAARWWRNVLDAVAGAETRLDHAQSMLGALHPVMIDLRVEALGREQVDAPAAFAEGARLLADSLYTGRTGSEELELGLRVAQAEALQRLGRHEHALRVAGWVSRRLGASPPTGRAEIAVRAAVCDARSRLATGDYAGLCSRARARAEESQGELAYLEALAFEREGAWGEAAARFRRAAEAGRTGDAMSARLAERRLAQIELRTKESA